MDEVEALQTLLDINKLGAAGQSILYAGLTAAGFTGAEIDVIKIAVASAKLLADQEYKRATCTAMGKYLYNKFNEDKAK